MSDIGKSAVTGTIWVTIDRFSYMFMQFIVNLILARLLMPDDFGAVGMLAIFISVSYTLIDGGFGSALIQKKEPTNIDYSTIFYWNLSFSLFLYLILFGCAPFIADYFKMPILQGVLRMTGLILIINSFIIIQNNRLRKQLAFKKLALVNFSSYLIASITAITMAYRGYGVWSLVALQLVQGGCSAAILWFITRWKPNWCFSVASLRELFGFGGYLLAANILQEICKNLQGVLIGHNFSVTQMGYYTQAYKLDNVVSYSIPQIFVQVMFPVYSSVQDDRERLKNMVAMNIRIISLCVFPFTGILIILAEPLITLLFGAKWLPSVPYFQILCVGGFFVSLQNINFYAVASQGKSRSLFNWSFYKWLMLILLMLVGMNWGMHGLLWGMVLSSLNIYLVNAYLVSKYIGYSIGKQLLSICPVALSVAISVGIALFLLEEFHFPFILDAVVFLIIYLSICVTFKLIVFSEVAAFLKQLLRRFLVHS